MARLKLTMVVEYNADPDDYQTDDPEEMARIDQRVVEVDPNGILALLDEEVVWKVEPVNG